MKMKKQLLSILVVAFLLINSNMVHATLWDLKADFSTVGTGGIATGIGPNGAWAYGTGGTLSDNLLSFTPFDVFSGGTALGSGWNYGTTVPFATVSTYANSSTDGEFIGHETPDASNANIYVWTASSDMIINISAEAWTPNDGIQNLREHDVSLRLYDIDGVSLLDTLWSEGVGGSMGNTSFETMATFNTNNISVLAGQTISFWNINTGSSGMVGSALTINNSAPVPVPTTILLFGTGLAGLSGTRLRRKKK